MSGLFHASHEIDESFGQACAEYGVSGDCGKVKVAEWQHCMFHMPLCAGATDNWLVQRIACMRWVC
jgi:hypothetical protein